MRTFLITLLFVSGPCSAETLRVVIADDLVRNMPHLVERTKKALARSGHQFEWLVLPNKRSFQTLIEGKAAIELIRTTFRIESYPQLSIIRPSAAQIPFQMITSVKTPHFCTAEEQAFTSMSVAGVIGVDAHTDFFYPKFGHHSEVTNFPSAYRYIGLGRADVTFLPGPIVNSIPPADLKSLEICDDRIDVFPLHSIIHRDFIWAKNSIESAYREAFAK